MSKRRGPVRSIAAPTYSRAVTAAIPEVQINRTTNFWLTAGQSIFDGLLLGLVLYIVFQLPLWPGGVHLEPATFAWDRIVLAGVPALSLTTLLTMVRPVKSARFGLHVEAGIIATLVTLSMLIAATADTAVLHIGLFVASPQIVVAGLVSMTAILLERSLTYLTIRSSDPRLGLAQVTTYGTNQARSPIGASPQTSRTPFTPAVPRSGRGDWMAKQLMMATRSTARAGQPLVGDRPPVLVDFDPATNPSFRGAGFAAGAIPSKTPHHGWEVEHSIDNLAWISTDGVWPERSTPSVSRSVKRLVDLTVSLTALSVLAPLMMVLALLVKLESRGPALFVQKRVGQDGKTFDLLKFRSMRVDAEVCTGPIFAKPNDPRCTRIGRFMRRHSLDELPQLINVVRGDMSIVGPRPERPYFVARFGQSVPRYAERHREKAGITGWAQVNGLRGDTSIDERIEYDLFYVENWSLAFDLKIMIQTMVEILQGHNAY